MAVAAALNKPLGLLYGPSSPDFTPPLSDKATVIRLITGYHKVRKGDSVGYHQSLIDIQPEQVMAALEAVANQHNQLPERGRLMHVLIVKTSSMGDVLHTLPALTDAMNAIPGIRFDWVVEEGFSQIPSWHPAVDKVIPVAIRRWRKNWFGSDTRQERCDFKRVVQQRSYDVVIDAQGRLRVPQIDHPHRQRGSTWPRLQKCPRTLCQLVL